MAGDEKNVGSGIELDELPDPFDKMNRLLGEIRNALTQRDRNEMLLDLSTVAPVSMHVRFRARLLVFSLSAAGTITVTIGTVARTFALAIADTRQLAFPIVIERGTDIALAAGGGAAVNAAYLIGERE